MDLAVTLRYRAVVLMRGHGMTVAATSVKPVVHTQLNAQLVHRHPWRGGAVCGVAGTR